MYINKITAEQMGQIVPSDPVLNFTTHSLEMTDAVNPELAEIDGEPSSYILTGGILPDDSPLRKDANISTFLVHEAMSPHLVLSIAVREATPGNGEVVVLSEDWRFDHGLIKATLAHVRKERNVKINHVIIAAAEAATRTLVEQPREREADTAVYSHAA